MIGIIIKLIPEARRLWCHFYWRCYRSMSFFRFFFGLKCLGSLLHKNYIIDSGFCWMHQGWILNQGGFNLKVSGDIGEILLQTWWRSRRQSPCWNINLKLVISIISVLKLIRSKKWIFKSLFNSVLINLSMYWACRGEQLSMRNGSWVQKSDIVFPLTFCNIDVLSAITSPKTFFGAYFSLDTAVIMLKMRSQYSLHWRRLAHLQVWRCGWRILSHYIYVNALHLCFPLLFVTLPW